MGVLHLAHRGQRAESDGNLSGFPPIPFVKTGGGAAPWKAGAHASDYLGDVTLDTLEPSVCSLVVAQSVGNL